MATFTAFQPGDIVQLKSGGPFMTIAWVNNGECGCVGYDKSAFTFINQRFPVEVIKPVGQSTGDATYERG